MGGSASGDYKVEVIAKGFQHDFWKAIIKAEKGLINLVLRLPLGPQMKLLLQNSLNNLTMLSISN